MSHIAKPIALLLTACCAMGLQAQELKKDVEIRYQETPELRNMTKLQADPTITLPPVTSTALPYSTGGVDITIPSSITTLEPAPYADTIYTSPYRGYAAIGFMPRFNLGASAGYKFLDTDHTRLNAWVQYDGTSYKGRPAVQIDPDNSHDKLTLRRQSATVGLNLHQAVGRESFIDLGADYTYARHNTPISDTRATNQNINRFNISGLWSMVHGNLSYGLGAAFSRFAPTNSWGLECLGPNPDDPTDSASHPAVATRESRYDIVGFLHGRLSNSSSAGLNIQFSHQGYNHDSSLKFGYYETLAHLDDPNHATLRLAPFYRMQKGQIDLNLGLNLDLTFNQGKTFHIAPAAQATWTPGDIVKVFIKANGGQHLNTLSSLYERNVYAVPFGAWRNSQVAFEAEAGVTVGTWRGFYAQISFTYARANDWLMATTTSDFDNNATNFFSTFTAIDMSGYKLHASVGYNFRNIADLKASFEMAPQKLNRGYYLWADRAKTVAEIDLTVHPIKALDLFVGWEYRGDRKNGVIIENAMSPDTYYYTLGALGSVNNLKAGALYRLTDRWSVFLTGENLLGRNYHLIGGVEAQGRTGLAGVTYKF